MNLFNYHSSHNIKEFIRLRVLTIDDFSDLFDGERRGFPVKTQTKRYLILCLMVVIITLVSVGEGFINLTNHYFVSGEVIEYVPPDGDPANSICISPTDFGPGIGTTTLLP